MYGGSRSISPLILKLVIRWRWVLNFSPPTLNPSVPIEKEVGWVQVGLDHPKKKNIFCTYVIRSPDFQAVP
jgi:hypothetical protein